MRKLILLLSLLLPMMAAAAPAPPVERNVFSTNTPVNAVLFGDVTTDPGTLHTHVNAGLTNGIILLSPPGGNNTILDMLTGVSTREAQIGISWSGNHAFNPWFSSRAGTGSNAWDNSVVTFSQGIQTIGDAAIMTPNFSPATKIYNNGNAVDASFAARGTRNGAYLYHYNMSPFTDGNMIALPMVTTNVVGAAVLTNSEGTKIYLRDEFGLVMGSIPGEFEIGETNQAGSYVLITGGNSGLPYYISMNQQLSGEVVAGYSQHYLAGFDTRSTSVGVHFPVQTPYCWTFTNALNRDALYIDELLGHVTTYTNLYVGNSLQVTNVKSHSIIGAASISGTVGSLVNQLGLTTTTNSHFGIPDGGGAYTFDYYDAYRLGFFLQNGQFMKMAHTHGTPFIIARDDQATLQVLPASAHTLTEELNFDGSGNQTASGTWTFSGTINNTALTASRVVGTDASKNLVSYTVGAGLLLTGTTITTNGVTTGGGSQTPWLSDINGALFSLTNANTIQGSNLVAIGIGSNYFGIPSTFNGGISNNGAFTNIGDVTIGTGKTIYLTNLTASRVVATDANKGLVSVADSTTQPINSAGTVATTFNGNANGLTNMIYDSYTNTWTTNTAIPLGNTNSIGALSGNTSCGFIGITFTSTYTERYGQLIFTTTGNVTFTNPATIRTSDTLDSRVIASGNIAIIGIDYVPGICTNMTIQQFVQ